MQYSSDQSKIVKSRMQQGWQERALKWNKAQAEGIPTPQVSYSAGTGIPSFQGSLPLQSYDQVQACQMLIEQVTSEPLSNRNVYLPWMLIHPSFQSRRKAELLCTQRQQQVGTSCPGECRTLLSGRFHKKGVYIHVKSQYFDISLLLQ